MKRFSVKAGHLRYPVLFEPDGNTLARIIGRVGQIVVVSNPTVFALHGQAFIRAFLPARTPIIPIMIGDGEHYKNRRTVSELYDHFFDIGLSRGDMVIALGGGVVGDTAGFAAATFKRGVRLLQAPTTLLAMVDSSIGGKVGINHARGKNLIGAFYQPEAVVVRPIWLSTLGRREIVEGLAEIIKAGFLSGDRQLLAAAAFNVDHHTRLNDQLARLAYRAMHYKAGIVARDVGDHNRRLILNFGHTFAHAIEKVEGFRRYRHGEAVMAGMAGAIYLSNLAGFLSDCLMRRELERLIPWIGELKLLKKDPGDYFRPMLVDKKCANGILRFILLRGGAGRPTITPVSSRPMILKAIARMQTFVNRGGHE